MFRAMLGPFCVIEAPRGLGKEFLIHKGPSTTVWAVDVALHNPCTLAGGLGPMGPPLPLSPPPQPNRSKPMKCQRPTFHAHLPLQLSPVRAWVPRRLGRGRRRSACPARRTTRKTRRSMADRFIAPPWYHLGRGGRTAQTTERRSNAFRVAAPSVVLSKMHQTFRPAAASVRIREARASMYSSE